LAAGFFGGAFRAAAFFGAADVLGFAAAFVLGSGAALRTESFRGALLRFELASSASRISLSASYWVIWPRRTMY
jgi:hypothetical protein